MNERIGWNSLGSVVYDGVGHCARSVIDDDYFTSTGLSINASDKLGVLRLTSSRDQNGFFHVSVLPAFSTRLHAFSTPSSNVVLRAAVNATSVFRSHAPSLSSATLSLLGTSIAPPSKKDGKKTAAVDVKSKGSSLGLICSWKRNAPWNCSAVWRIDGDGSEARNKAAVCATVAGRHFNEDVLVGVEGAIRASDRVSLAMCAAARCRSSGRKRTEAVRFDGRVEYRGEAWNALGYVERRGRSAGVTLSRILNGGLTRFVIDTVFMLPHRSRGDIGGGSEEEGHEEIENDKRENTGTKVVVGVEHRPDFDSIVKVKLDTHCVLRAVYSIRTSPWCTQAFSFAINLADYNASGNHTAAFSIAIGG